ncbi:MAG TPA: hypothetical protein DER26_05085 [Verrucomicrobia bacterium]|nr:hypothetical protein [Verrucomicrobiota bacterium]
MCRERNENAQLGGERAAGSRSPAAFRRDGIGVPAERRRGSGGKASRFRRDGRGGSEATPERRLKKRRGNGKIIQV